MNRSMTSPPSWGATAQSPRRLGMAFFAAAAAFSLAACGGNGGGNAGGGDAGGDGGGADSELTIALISDEAPNGYDPLLYSQGQFQFFSAMYDALFVTSAEGTPEPSLVSEHANSEDNLTTTLTLREGVTFADGSTLDSALVKANLDRRTDTDLEAYGQIAPGGASEITDVAAPDPQTVVITWAKPQANPATIFADTAGIIVGPEAVADPDTLETTPDGSGPYTLDEGATTRASTYTLTKNDDAWNADAYAFDTVVYNVITDPQALANAVVSGQADVGTRLDPKTVDLVASRQSIAEVGGTIVGFPILDKTGERAPAFAKEEARLALHYATDRESLVNDLHPGARPTSQLFPESAVGFDPALDEEYGYDPEKAKELLAAAGYPDGFELTQTVLGKPSEDAVVIQSQWAEVGVKLTFITATSTDALFASVGTDPVIFGPFAVGNNPAGFVAGAMYNGFMNVQGAKEPEIEAALGGALGGTGEAQEQALADLNAAITNNGWFIPVYEDIVYVGYNADEVTEPKFAGTNTFLVLSEIKPAS